MTVAPEHDEERDRRWREVLAKLPTAKVKAELKRLSGDGRLPRGVLDAFIDRLRPMPVYRCCRACYTGKCGEPYCACKEYDGRAMPVSLMMHGPTHNGCSCCVEVPR